MPMRITAARIKPSKRLQYNPVPWNSRRALLSPVLAFIAASPDPELLDSPPRLSLRPLIVYLRSCIRVAPRSDAWVTNPSVRRRQRAVQRLLACSSADLRPPSGGAAALNARSRCTAVLSVQQRQP